ncbi:MAG: DUF72 domain-containing protein [Methanomicrobiaceae archaeon]|nr:DUF72 domain-containing protein [Methanomicrobiaceae archaeon]
MEVYVGTSGWYYEWNEEKSLDWFLEHSGLNTVELNASFYRFPYPNMIKSWVEKGADLSWSVKVHRSVTHSHLFNEEGFAVWEKFRDAFSPLDDLIDFYLFQAPPRFDDADRLIDFVKETGLGDRCAVEVRNSDLLGDDDRCASIAERAVLVSVDSPDFQNRIFSGPLLYLRMHGRDDWYKHDYTGEELEDTASIIRDRNPEQVHVFFNNDHAMLDNARAMTRILAD